MLDKGRLAALAIKLSWSTNARAGEATKLHQKRVRSHNRGNYNGHRRHRCRLHGCLPARVTLKSTFCYNTNVALLGGGVLRKHVERGKELPGDAWRPGPMGGEARAQLGSTLNRP